MSLFPESAQIIVNEAQTSFRRENPESTQSLVEPLVCHWVPWETWFWGEKKLRKKLSGGSLFLGEHHVMNSMQFLVVWNRFLEFFCSFRTFRSARLRPFFLYLTEREKKTEEGADETNAEERVHDDSSSTITHATAKEETTETNKPSKLPHVTKSESSVSQSIKKSELYDEYLVSF